MRRSRSRELRDSKAGLYGPVASSTVRSACTVPSQPGVIRLKPPSFQTRRRDSLGTDGLWVRFRGATVATESTPMCAACAALAVHFFVSADFSPAYCMAAAPRGIRCLSSTRYIAHRRRLM